MNNVFLYLEIEGTTVADVSLEPVSYTHLDVYKRQYLMNVLLN